jgi:hypothetical protein
MAERGNKNKIRNQMKQLHKHLEFTFILIADLTITGMVKAQEKELYRFEEYLSLVGKKNLAMLPEIQCEYGRSSYSDGRYVSGSPTGSGNNQQRGE